MSEPKDLEQLVSLCVANHTPEELALGWLRYETLRRLNPRQFHDLWRVHLSGQRFDDLVTDALLEWKAPHAKPQ